MAEVTVLWGFCRDEPGKSAQKEYLFLLTLFILLNGIKIICFQVWEITSISLKSTSNFDFVEVLKNYLCIFHLARGCKLQLASVRH